MSINKHTPDKKKREKELRLELTSNELAKFNEFKNRKNFDNQREAFIQLLDSHDEVNFKKDDNTSVNFR